MTPLFKKLNLKNHRTLLVVDPPARFTPELAALTASVEDVTVHTSGGEAETVPFLLVFVQTADDVAAAARLAETHTTGDAVVWLAYPKKASKRYTSVLSRDEAPWQAMGAVGFEGVRQVAIDADWSALRFRRVAFIKSMKRDPKRAMTAVGKARVATAVDSKKEQRPASI